MPVLKTVLQGANVSFDGEQCAAAGAERAERYQNASPFPHIAMDDFIDRALLGRVVAEFPNRHGQIAFDRDQERHKYQFNPNTIDSAVSRNLLAALNSEPFLKFLTAMTGIKGLIPDPYFSGGGLHETLSGGHLSIHADFNIHGQMDVERRLNLLIYLNEDWPTEFGGQLELWDKKMRKAAVSIPPTMGKAVLFNTTLQSFHGQPDPVRCPENRSRRSIATYYYTAFPGERKVPKRTTTFQTRPQSSDSTDWRVRYRHFVEDWVPPRLQRYAKRLS